MRQRILVGVLVVAAACAKQETPAADTAAAAPPPPKALALADVAGNWTQKAYKEGTDSLMVTGDVSGTADAAGWMITLPGRKAMPMTVSVDGDSMMTASGPYESVLRKGVQVTTNGVLRMKDGMLVGSTTAHYTVKTADSVLHLRMELTRKP